MKIENKIGIITLNGYYNYGNRLQNYALQETLKKFDYEVETIIIDRQNNNKVGLFKKIMRIFKRPNIIIKKIKNIIYLDKLNSKKEKRFKVFSEKYIRETSFSISKNRLPENLLYEYDFFVTGSDQVWNPYFINASSLYFLTFAPKNKRVAYSPSFGISEIPTEYVKNYSQWLSEIPNLSVRENAGAKIIKDLTGKDSQVLADPTLLVDKEDWLKISKPAKNKIKSDFILTYFLGGIPKEVKELIDKYRIKRNLKVVNLAVPKNRDVYLTDPSEFLDYINTSKLFITDSFHGSVFSILFKTPFIVTDRKGTFPSMNSRIITLLNKYKLESRHINKINENEIDFIDFNHIESILLEERKIAFDYLKKALDNKKTKD